MTNARFLSFNRLFMAAVAASLTIFSPAVAAQSDSPTNVVNGGTAVREYKMKNGLKILLLEEHSFPVATCMMLYRVGSRNENLGETGLSHLVEHLLFQRIGKLRKGELEATIARNGGQFNGFTSDDFTVFFETFAPGRLPLALKIEAERMKAAQFNAEDVQAEIKKVEKELGDEARDTLNLLNKEVKSAAFQLHPYKNPTIGWRSDVAKLTLDDVKRHYREYYQPANATLIVVGDFKTEATLQAIQQNFGSIAGGEAPRAVRVTEPLQRAERRVYLKSPANADSVSVAYHAPAFSDNDAAAMAVLEKILMSGPHGRLKSRLVDSKICVSAKCTYEVKRDPGLFTINLVGAPGASASKLQQELESVLDQIKSSPVQDTELKRAHNQAEFQLLAERDGPYRTALHLALFESLDSWPMAYTWFEKLAQVNQADIQRVARRYFTQENRVLGVLSGQNKPAPKPVATDKDQDKNKAKPQESKKDAKPQNKPHKAMSGHQPSVFFNAVAYQPENTADTVQGAGGGTSTNSDAAAADTAVKNLDSKLQQFVLPSGMQIAVIETKLSPVVQIYGAVRAGEAYEPVGKRGTSSVLAQAMMEGSSRFSRQQAFVTQDDLGIAPNAMIKFSAGHQLIRFSARCLPRDTFAITSILASQLKEPALRDQDLESARKTVVDRIKRVDESVKNRVDRALLRGLIAPNTSFYPLEPVDKIKFVGNLKVSDLKEFHQQAVRPDATALVFIGDITAQKAREIVEHAFEGYNGKSTAKKVAVKPNPRRLLKSSIIVERKQDTMVTLGKMVDSNLGKADYPLLLMADCALTNHPLISRFAERISGETGMASSVSLEDLASDTQSYPDSTLWSVDIPLIPNAMPQAVKTIQSELKTFGRTGVTPHEFSEVRLYLAGAIPVRFMANAELAARTTLESLLLENKVDPLPELIDGVKQATVEKLNRFITDVFRPNRASLVIAGTKQAIGQVHGIGREEKESE